MKKSVCLFLSLLLLFTTGCGETENGGAYPSGSQNPSVSDDSSVYSSIASAFDGADENTRLKTVLSSGISIDAAVDTGGADLNNLPEFQAEITPLQADVFLPVLAADRKILERHQEPAGDSRVSDTYEYIVLEEDAVITCNGEILYFDTPLSRSVSHIFRTEGQNQNKDAFLTGRALSFCSIAEAESAVLATLHQLNIPVADGKCYTLDVSSMQAEQEKQTAQFSEETPGIFVGSGETHTMTQQDECYVFIFPVTVAGMPVSIYPNGVYGDGSLMTGTSVQVLYGQNGIAGLEFPYLLQQADAAASYGQGIPLEAATELLDNKFGAIILEGEYLVTEITFAYAPVVMQSGINRFDMVPAWWFTFTHTFTLASKNDTGEPVPWEERQTVAIHAITWEEIRMDMGGI